MNPFLNPSNCNVTIDLCFSMKNTSHFGQSIKERHLTQIIKLEQEALISLRDRGNGVLASIMHFTVSTVFSPEIDY